MILEPRRELVKPSLADVLRFAPIGSGLDFLHPLKIGSPAVTSPDSVALTAWYAEDSTISSTDVDQWTDKSGNARHLAGAGSARPTWEASGGPNSHPCILFDGVDDVLTRGAITNLITTAAHCIYVVMKVASADIDTDAAQAFSNDSIMSDTSGRFALSVRSTGPNVQQYIDDGGADVTIERTFTSAAWVAVRFRHNGGTAYIKSTGQTETSAARGTMSAPGNTRIGNYVTAGKEFKGRLAALVIHNDGDAHAQTEAYILDRFGVVV